MFEGITVLRCHFMQRIVTIDHHVHVAIRSLPATTLPAAVLFSLQLRQSMTPKDPAHERLRTPDHSSDLHLRHTFGVESKHVRFVLLRHRCKHWLHYPALTTDRTFD